MFKLTEDIIDNTFKAKEFIIDWTEDGDDYVLNIARRGAMFTKNGENVSKYITDIDIHIGSRQIPTITIKKLIFSDLKIGE